MMGGRKESETRNQVTALELMHFRFAFAGTAAYWKIEVYIHAMSQQQCALHPSPRGHGVVQGSQAMLQDGESSDWVPFKTRVDCQPVGMDSIKQVVVGVRPRLDSRYLPVPPPAPPGPEECPEHTPMSLHTVPGPVAAAMITIRRDEPLDDLNLAQSIVVTPGMRQLTMDTRASAPARSRIPTIRWSSRTTACCKGVFESCMRGGVGVGTV